MRIEMADWWDEIKTHERLRLLGEIMDRNTSAKEGAKMAQTPWRELPQDIQEKLTGVDKSLSLARTLYRQYGDGVIGMSDAELVRKGEEKEPYTAEQITAYSRAKDRWGGMSETERIALIGYAGHDTPDYERPEIVATKQWIDLPADEREDLAQYIKHLDTTPGQWAQAIAATAKSHRSGVRKGEDKVMDLVSITEGEDKAINWLDSIASALDKYGDSQAANDIWGFIENKLKKHLDRLVELAGSRKE